MRRTIILIALVGLVGCGEPQIVKETVVVEQTVEVEVEVTRVVEETVVVQKIVTPTATATPRATPVPETGTRQNPHPLGISATLVQGGKLEFEFTVLEAIRGEEAYNRILAANQFNDAAGPGYEYVMAHVQANYNGEDQGVLELDQYGTSVVTNGRIMAFFEMPTTPCCIEPAFDFSLFQGGQADGWVALTVAIDDPNPLLNLGGADGVYFSLTAQE